jgi:hypothetical protein
MTLNFCGRSKRRLRIGFGNRAFLVPLSGMSIFTISGWGCVESWRAGGPAGRRYKCHRLLKCEPATFVRAAGEAAGPPWGRVHNEGTQISRECVGGPAAPPAAGTNATDTRNVNPQRLYERPARPPALHGGVFIMKGRKFRENALESLEQSFHRCPPKASIQ